ncbi:MAG: hypothetical protein IT204_13975 [Fimbriimonadaceae bacterium]|nr:hypothetical protein [Fimbriimonadaceae bacterium]
MRGCSVLLVGLWCALAGAQPPAGREGILVPRAVGVANLAGDFAAARERALVDAKRNAVEAALGVMVKSETKVELYELVADQAQVESREGVVFDDQILEEKRDDAAQAVYVTIRCRVASRPLIAQLEQGFPQVYAAIEKPRLAVVLAETGGQRIGTGLVQQLLQAGLEVVDKQQIDALGDADQVAQAAAGNPAAMAWLVGQAKSNLNVELLLVGRADGTAGAASAEVRVVNTWDARIIAAGQAQGADAAAVVRGLLPGGAEQRDLLGQMLATWVTQPTTITLTLSKASFQQVRDLLSGLEPFRRPRTVDFTRPAESSRLPIVGEAIRRSFSPAVSLVEIRTPLRRSAAIDAVSELVGQLGFSITNVDGLRINAAPAPPT